MTVSVATMDLVKRHEGFRCKVYIDTTGHQTIGYGRNLSACGISSSEAETMLINDLAAVESELIRLVPIYTDLSEARKSCLMDMAFNLGIHGLLEFKEMLAYVTAGNFASAAQCMRESKWHLQVHGRADDDAFLMEKG